MRNRILPLSIVLLLFCQCRSAAVKEHLFGNYYLMAIDVKSQMSLCYHEPSDGSNYGTIIGPTVTAIGYNESFLIAKQNPMYIERSNKNSSVNFFILPIKEEFNWRTMNGLIGPISYDQYKLERHILNIPDSLTLRTFD